MEGHRVRASRAGKQVSLLKLLRLWVFKRGVEGIGISQWEV